MTQSATSRSPAGRCILEKLGRKCHSENTFLLSLRVLKELLEKGSTGFMHMAFGQAQAEADYKSFLSSQCFMIMGAAEEGDASCHPAVAV